MMPSFSTYKRMLTAGEAKKLNADITMEATWWEDPASQVAYLYDWYHDDDHMKLNNIDPTMNEYKVPIDIKYIIATTQTYSKDSINYHIQLKPSQKCNVPYYEELFGGRYDAHFPVGLYVDVVDASGKYNRWLVVGLANYNDPQFPTYEILRCDKVIQYIDSGTKYNVAGVLRSQNSYNSGLWIDQKIETTEDQYKFLLPLNRDTEKLNYNHRIILDNKVLTEPRVWKISKINRTAANGICVYTCSQDHFDQHKDYVEKDANGNVVAMWADYYSSAITPEDPEPIMNATIKCSGIKPQFKVGGSYKKLTVEFEDGDEVEGEWKFEYNGEPATNIVTLTQPNPLEIKAKFVGGDDCIGEVFMAKYIAKGRLVAQLELEVVPL